jgi:hypothetical protein
MNAEQIQVVLAAHNLWLSGDAKGTRADLRDADLRGADLTGAVLRLAVLTRADLTDADLTGADLTGADLTGAVLRGAVLTRAVLTGAVLTGAFLTGAVLTDADLTDADLRGATISSPGGIAVPWHKPDSELPRKVAAAALVEGALDMGSWHTCETTHCLAGWAIQLSGAAGRIFEATTSPSVAGSILMPSASHLFFAGNEEAKEWCRQQLNNTKHL